MRDGEIEEIEILCDACEIDGEDWDEVVCGGDECVPEGGECVSVEGRLREIARLHAMMLVLGVGVVHGASARGLPPQGSSISLTAGS